MPLLIGGATTSKRHTALRIDPAYYGPGDPCPRRQPRGRRRLGAGQRRTAARRADRRAPPPNIDALRDARAGSGAQRAATLEEARANGFDARPDGQARAAAQPGVHHVRRLAARATCASRSTGRRSSARGSWPAIIPRSSTTRSSAKARAACSPTPRRCSTQIIAEKWLTRAGRRSACGRCRARGRRCGRPSPATSARPPPLPAPAGEEARGPRQHVPRRFHRPDGRDWIGGFAVGIHGIEPHLERFRADNDDYSDILLKALADRLAEAFAERLHQHVRTDLWGYAPDEQLTNEAADPRDISRHPPRAGLSRLPRPQPQADPVRHARRRAAPGSTLTENFAMLPTSAVSGFYFGHPRQPIFRRRADRPRPARGLCRAARGRSRHARRAGCGPTSTSRRERCLARQP